MHEAGIVSRPSRESRVRVEEDPKGVGQYPGLIDGDEGSGVVDPLELGVREVVGESFGVGEGHELVVSCQMMRTGPAKVLCRSAWRAAGRVWGRCGGTWSGRGTPRGCGAAGRSSFGDHGGDRRQGQVGALGHRRGVRAGRQLRDDAAVAIPQALDDGVPQGAIHQHPVQQHHHRPVAVIVDEMIRNRCRRRS